MADEHYDNEEPIGLSVYFHDVIFAEKYRHFVLFYLRRFFRPDNVNGSSGCIVVKIPCTNELLIEPSDEPGEKMTIVFHDKSFFKDNLENVLWIVNEIFPNWTVRKLKYVICIDKKRH